MLRVSSLGLRHDKSRLFFPPLYRYVSTAAYQTTESSDQRKHPHHGENRLVGASPDSPEKSLSPMSQGSPGLDRSDLRGVRRLTFATLQLHEPHPMPVALRESQAKTAYRELSPAFTTEVSDSLPEGLTSAETSMDMPSAAESTQEASREELENIMDTTDEVERAWEAYQYLSVVSLPEDGRHVRYYARLHRLARLLSKVKPRTRTLFLRLLSVLSTLHQSGGNVHTWEWNLLIDCAGKSWRKTRPEDFKAALDVYRDMIERKGPGSTFDRDRFSPNLMEERQEVVRPDIVTYTTLLNIAGRTLQHAILRHARGILEASGISPNRITYLALVRYYSRKSDLTGVRAILSKMREQGMELGLDGVNACVWAYARAGRIDVASLLYRVVRHNLIPEDEVGEHDIEAAIRQLLHTEGLEIPATIKPDATTYYTLIQCYAYHGQLTRALEVFREMLAVSNQLRILDQELPDDDPSRTDRSPTLPAFRAIFLGFARHGGKDVASLARAGPLTQRLVDSRWTMENLQALFDAFMKLPHDARPSERTVFWVLTAFDVLSGHANWKLRRVWERLTERFGDYQGGRLERFRKRIYESDQKE
ncbi:hypothetical protein DAEQUDRAFT_809908 [Daedalea quercina L-15889]|uniref:Pentacotripeptide-repeat region of PRORP domain-containing protein n=1 Tax=Daedalea quercina L-15889 TaxID=1314783 RepID=A0A165S6R3_9APHY|nr:hypothetical protein DAEQUDRAFT_809908 [Daedalea quercina L-15889]